MPKPFMIGVQVEERFFGSILRKLDKMAGVVKVDLHLNGNGNGHAKPKSSSRSSRPREENFKLIQRHILQRKKPVPRRELIEMLGKTGMSKGASDGAIYTMRDRGLIMMKEPGVFWLTAKGKEWKPESK